MGSGLLCRGGTQRVRCLSRNPIRATTGGRRLAALTLDTNESLATAWTADSKAVLFVSDRNGTWKLFKQNIDETTAEVLVEGRSMRFPRLSADGSQVLYLVESETGDHSLPASLMSKPLAGGPPRLVLRENGISNYQCARAPSQLCIFSKLVGDDHILVSFDLEHGARSRDYENSEWLISLEPFPGWIAACTRPGTASNSISLTGHRCRSRC